MPSKPLGFAVFVAYGAKKCSKCLILRTFGLGAELAYGGDLQSISTDHQSLLMMVVVVVVHALLGQFTQQESFFFLQC